MLQSQSSTATLYDATSRVVTGYGPDFVNFHNANPHVYDALVQGAREWMRQKPGRKLGLSLLWSKARWELSIETSGSEYKLNDAFQAYYARLLAMRNPEMANLFNFRKSQADGFMARHYVDCL